MSGFTGCDASELTLCVGSKTSISGIYLVTAQLSFFFFLPQYVDQFLKL